MNRMVVLLALNVVACGAASAPASQPSTSVGPERIGAVPAPSARSDDTAKEDHGTLGTSMRVRRLTQR
jgi:hypothetical protein